MQNGLVVENVSKCFRIQKNRPRTIRDAVIQRFNKYHDSVSDLWALRDITFSVKKGTVLGLIGHNGAGKSTLLRLLCGLGKPTRGYILRPGNIGTLLELGSGFHIDMTGRENLMTGGLLSGLTTRQVKAVEEKIIHFAELEKFIDQPVRTYSSGMYLRLAFSTAIHFDPDYLIIDEVLAVGDSRFQQKCLDRLYALRDAGKSFIIATHDMEQARFLCNEVIVLEEGRIAMQGDPESAISCYHDLMRQRSERRAENLSGEIRQHALPERGSRLGTQEAFIHAVNIYDNSGTATDSILSGEALTLELQYRLVKPVSDMALTLGIYSTKNVKCFEATLNSTSAMFGTPEEHGRFICHIPELHLLSGQYFINVGIYPCNWDFVYDYHWQMHVLHVVEKQEHASNITGVISVNPRWSA
ncbi:MAG: ABC transporter ATP-binding protein [Nitrospirota bacterium]